MELRRKKGQLQAGCYRAAGENGEMSWRAGRIR